MPISPDAKRITNIIYKVYGTDSGCLFGIPPEKREKVEAIVQATIEIFMNDTKEKR